jgi:hypothetical protein
VRHNNKISASARLFAVFSVFILSSLSFAYCEEVGTRYFLIADDVKDSTITAIKGCLTNNETMPNWRSCWSGVLVNCFDKGTWTTVAQKECSSNLYASMKQLNSEITQKLIGLFLVKEGQEEANSKYLLNIDNAYRSYEAAMCGWPNRALTGGTDMTLLEGQCSLELYAGRLFEINKAYGYSKERQ